MSFGCCVWISPHVIQRCQFKADAKKGIVLGYIPHTDCSILWYVYKTKIVKVTSHCKFHEDFNGIPIESVSLGFQKLIQINFNERLPEDYLEVDTKDLDFFVYLFSKK